MPIFASGLPGNVFASLLPFSSPSLPLPDWGRRWCGYRVVDHNNGEDDGDDDDMYEASVMDELCLISLLNHFIWIN